jgi:hypothetical protein
MFVIVLALGALPAFAEQTVSLFDGRDLTGWTKRGGAATYAAEDGAIVGRSVPNTWNTFLATDKEYDDFVLEFDVKVDGPDFNSGVQIRSRSRLKDEKELVFGYQVEIDPSERSYSGGIYWEGGSPERKGDWLQDLANNEAARKAFRQGEWNHLKIVANGRRIQTWVNDVPAADYTDTDDKAFTPAGFIGLQVHSVGDRTDTKEVRWKNIKLTELE